MAAPSRRTWRRILFALAFALLSAAAGIAALLGTERGRQALLDAVCALASTPAIRLEMTGLQPGTDWTLQTLTVSDPSGPWLRVRNLSLRPVPGALLAGRIALDHLGADDISLDRLPAAAESSGRVALPRLRIRSIDAGRIRLGPAVAGSEALLTLHGELSLDSRTIRGRLQVARLDRADDRLDLDGHADLAGRTLALDLKLREAPGGLLHAMLNANGTQEITLEAAGRGPLQQFPLTLEAHVADLCTITGNATLDAETGADMAIAARLSPGSDWTARTGLPGVDTDLTARAAWTQPVLDVSVAEVRSSLAAVAGNCTWDTASGTLTAAFDGKSLELQPLLPSGITAGAASVQGRIRLDGAGAGGRFQGHMSSWTIAGNALDEAVAEVDLELPAGQDRWEIKGRGNASGSGLPEGLREWTVNATLGGNRGGTTIQELRLDSDKLGIQLDGRVDREIALDGRIAIRDVLLASGSRLAAALGASLRGRFEPLSRTLSADLNLDVDSLQGIPRELDAVLGPDARAGIRFTASPRKLTVHDARLKARTSIGLQGDYDLDTDNFQAAFTAVLPELRSGNLVLAQGLDLRGEAKGTPAAFALDLGAARGRMQAGALDLRDIGGKAAVRGLPTRPALTVQARMQASGNPASLALEAAYDKKGVHIAKCRVELPGNEFTASGTLLPSSLLFAGTADFKSSDLNVPARIFNADLTGTLNLQAELSAGKNTQQAHIDALAENVRAWGVSLGHASLRGATAWSGALSATDMQFELRSAKYGPLKTDLIKGNLEGPGPELSFGLHAEHAATDTAIKAAGTFSDGQRLRIDSLRGKLLREPLQLASPLDVVLGPKEARWDETTLNFGRASLTSKGRLSPDKAEISTSLRNMDPALLRPLFPNLPGANINANLEVRGTPEAPDAKLEMRADDIRVRAIGLDNLQGLVASVEVMLHQDRIDARADVASARAVALEAQFSCPVRPALPAIHIAPDAPLSGRIGGYAELGILPNLLRLADQTVEGRCDLDLRISGTQTNPELTGTAKVRKGRYENFRSGTAVESADVDARANGSRVDLNATATDGGKGRALGRGTVDLAAMTYAFDVDFQDFRLIRLDLAQGTATGPFRFEGDLDGSILTGDLVLDPSTVNLPRSTAKEAPDIDIVEINAGTASSAGLKALPSYLIGMDLNADIPARLTIRGRSLESEWAGRLHIGGNHVRPSVSGEIHLLRGKYDFLDRTFDLTKGSIMLNGDTPSNPFLDMVGETQILDTQVQVHLNGPARNFRLSLTSVPALPQDELLAMILFGRSMHEISPLQAVVLAQTAAEMTGVGPGLDILGTIKSRLGLQEVDVSKDENDNTAVGIGGYIGGKYYIRTQRSVSGQDRTRVEVQLTPKISVETEVGGDSRQGGGINWKHDY